MNAPQAVPLKPPQDRTGTALALACFLIIATYVLMIDLKGISTDEGIRLGVMNAGQPFMLNQPPPTIEWAKVIEANRPFAYQPLYFLIQHTLMSVARTQDVVFLRIINIGFLWVCLLGLISLSRSWRLPSRLFLLGVFSFNAYLIMHVLQIREYIVGVAFYVWSTWFVLQLDERRLGRSWADIGWFAAYGVLLTLGFYVQSWVAFPAIGQFLFLALRRSEEKLRFFAHLAFSYLIVLCATLPYLQAHRQKVDVGRWGAEGTNLWLQLSEGFHLVLTGHLRHHSPFTDVLFWFWLAVLAGAGLLLFSRPARAAAAALHRETARQWLLMLLSMAVPLGFQIAYFYRVDNLSVWPRYFVIHYFFLTWLLALAVHHFSTLATAADVTIWPRRLLRAGVGTMWLVMLVSAGYQTRSYYADPTLDTGLSRTSNWRVVAEGMSRVIRPDDVLLTHEFLNRATLTFTRPLTNRVMMLKELEAAELKPVERFVYLEPGPYLPGRGELVARMAKLGFGSMEEIRIRAPDGVTLLPDWRLLVFQRR